MAGCMKTKVWVGIEELKFMALLCSALQYCPGMTGQDCLQIILLYKYCLFPFKYSSDYTYSSETCRHQQPNRHILT